MTSPPGLDFEKTSLGPPSGGGAGVSLAKAAADDLNAVDAALATPSRDRVPAWWAVVTPEHVVVTDEPAVDGGAPVPGPLPVAPLPVADPPTTFGWEFDGGYEQQDAGPQRRLGAAYVVAAVLVVVAVVIVLASVLTGGDSKGGAKGPAAPAVPAGSTPPTTDYIPRSLTLGVFEKRVQVAWQPPQRFGEVVGYMVVVQTREGAVLEHRLLPARETTATFESPPMTADACVVVATLVRGVDGVVPTRAEPVCR